MSTAVKIRPLIAPKVDRKAGRDLLQQHIELMDHLREVQRRMIQLTPKREDYHGETFTTWHYASTRWHQRLADVRRIYDEIQAVAIDINQQIL